MVVNSPLNQVLPSDPNLAVLFVTISGCFKRDLPFGE